MNYSKRSVEQPTHRYANHERCVFCASKRKTFKEPEVWYRTKKRGEPWGELRHFPAAESR